MTQIVIRVWRLVLLMFPAVFASAAIIIINELCRLPLTLTGCSPGARVVTLFRDRHEVLSKSNDGRRSEYG